MNIFISIRKIRKIRDYPNMFYSDAQKVRDQMFKSVSDRKENSIDLQKDWMVNVTTESCRCH